MYLEFYGLKELPFELTPNPRYLFFGTKHREAFDHLVYGIRERKGFVQLTGDVGCGKTTLCRALLRQFGDQFSTALILNPAFDLDQLLRAIALEFGLPAPREHDRFQLVSALNQFLIELLYQGRDAVLIIDEAQTLSSDLLEQIRLLSNLETDERKLLQIVLLGQPELRDRLNEPGLQQLRQRITVRFHLAPLTRAEVAPYIAHRMQVAGANGLPEFTLGALWRIHRYSGGVPRLVNALCDKCLLAGYLLGRKRFTGDLVARAVDELEGRITA